MEINWEECSIPAPTSSGLNVTVGPAGEIVIGTNAYTKFGRPDAVVLMYDRENGLVGLKAVHPGAPNAYPVLSVEKWGHKIIRACRFWNHIGIRYRTRTKFASPEIENGVLKLDLTTAYPMKRNSAKNSN